MKDLFYKMLSKIGLHVYVVVAYDFHQEKLKECKVFFSQAESWDYYEEIKNVYIGNDRVAYFSRRIL